MSVFLINMTMKISYYAFFSEFDVLFKGSDSVERKGVYYTISEKDHPVTKLLQSPYKVTRGTAVQIGLGYRKVEHIHLRHFFALLIDRKYMTSWNCRPPPSFSHFQVQGLIYCRHKILGHHLHRAVIPNWGAVSWC